ncbi:aminoglycoside phosphotransferase family enzyme/predicted kinase [Azospirillum agricola]|uniref:bifunctional aminoglycoside phosphotransferase/ATP-binding protein n=1 Tax=Azospirillum agricola TaxID=1720247 RepID=UPI001AE8EAC3|nr:AAA family ATPase [Azospirillum agricola]MBP2232000.1 aminoglycoside phosphotransferase family enzyme/predicted kinase [Azospirillum agricola]
MPPIDAAPSTDRSQAGTLAFLGDPRSHGGRPVERVDTHAAVVFLAGGRAYKLKRAVRYPYLDYSTVEKREAACRAELTINRRTAPTLYRDVLAIRRRPDGGLFLDEAGDGARSGPAVDWVVAMRRFPADALFDRMAERGALTPAIMRALAGRVAAFHAAAEVRRDGGGEAALRAVVDGNIAEMAESPALFPTKRLGRLAARSAAALDRLKPLLERRRRDGFVRRCHGDLHLRNILLLDGVPTLFDAIEFDETLAVTDLLYDLAFLLMDLERRGLRPLGNALLNGWLDETGDRAGLAALPLFLSVRAAVRAKIAAAAAALSPGKAEELAAEARRGFDHAVAALEPPPPRLVAVGGLSGTGKSLLAHALAPALGPAPGAVILRSDALRKRMRGVPETERLPPDAYDPAVTARVYAALLDGARTVLEAGHAVVVDAVCARPEERAALESLAAAASVRFDGIWLDAALELRALRVTNRRNDASDATAEVAKRQESYDLGDIRWARLDSGRVAADVLADARATLA